MTERETYPVDVAGVTRELARELEDFGLIQPHVNGGEKRYVDADADVAAACAKFRRYGIDPRNLKKFRTAADNQAALLEQLVAPALRSRNPERRQAGLEELQALFVGMFDHGRGQSLL